MDGLTTLWFNLFFFDDILRLIKGAERQYGVANINYTEYILERFEFCIITCTSMLNQLRTVSSASLDDYCVSLNELIECLRIIFYKWEEYEGILHSDQSSHLSYQVPVTHSVGRLGRLQSLTLKGSADILSISLFHMD